MRTFSVFSRGFWTATRIAVPASLLVSLRLPITRVNFEFDNYTAAEAGALLDRFSRYLHRGGG